MIARHARAAELDAIIETLTSAFADDPVQQWLFEPAADPIAGIRALFEVFVPAYFRLGHAYVLDNGAGAALWAPPDRHALGQEAVGELLTALAPHLGGELLPRLSELARTAEYYPSEPYLYLGILGVAADQQGRGLGPDLVTPMLDECDRMGMLAHLESSNPRNISFYERLGFETVDAYRCGGDGALMTIMTRRPAGCGWTGRDRH